MTSHVSRSANKTVDLALFLPRVEAASDRTTANYRSCITAFLKSAPATLEGFAAYIDGMKRRQMASTVNVALSAGRKAFVQAAEKLGLPAYDIAAIKGTLHSIPGVKKAPPEVATVTPEERVALFAALPLRVRLVAEVLYITGARVTEIVKVRRNQITIKGAIELRLFGKGSKERVSKIPRALYRRILKEFPEGEYLFYTRTGAPFHREYISREIARVAKRVLGRSVSAHVLRHSRATDLLNETGRITAVSRLLGHADESVTLKYYVNDRFSDAELFAGMRE
jgi:integrase/recombinase XerD